MKEQTNNNLEYTIKVLQNYGIQVIDNNMKYRSVCDVMTDICRTFRFWRSLNISREEFEFRKYNIFKALVGMIYIKELY